MRKNSYIKKIQRCAFRNVKLMIGENTEALLTSWIAKSGKAHGKDRKNRR